MALERYDEKRDFSRTPEPRARKGATPSRRLYVIQKHRSRLLHYDLRLEHNGVLLSWALPKGPSLDPGEKRLAVQTEDHPIEYGSFEGIIPEGEYGGGTVMLWDRGEWSAAGSIGDGHRRGKLKVRLSGQKLHGGWTLVRMRGEASGGGKNWLFIKERDEHARVEGDYCVVDEEPYSVASNRTMQEIAETQDRVWSSEHGLEETLSGPDRKRRCRERLEMELRALATAQRSKQPRKLNPVRAAKGNKPPDGEEWLHEIRFEGHRLLAFITDDQIRLANEEGEDWTRKLPEIARRVALLPVGEAILDGQITLMNAQGLSDGRALAEMLEKRKTSCLTYHVFDVPCLMGRDLRKVPLLERKELLAGLLKACGDDSCYLHYSDHIRGNGPTVYEHANCLGAPGIVSKRADGGYSGKPARNWVDTPCSAPESGKSPDERSEVSSKAGVVVEPGLDVEGVRVTHPDRILYAEDRITKRALVHYCEAVAEWMLPHVANRPLSLYRCPEGFEKECFFQKHLGGVSSEHLRSVHRTDKKNKEPYVWLGDLAGLITLTQWNVLEIHPWGSRVDDVDKPDRLIFDLDPGPGVEWGQLVTGARDLRAVLEELGLKGFVKTSGGKGVHVVVPLVRRLQWGELKEFGGQVARIVERAAPDRYLTTMTKAKRPAKIFIDFFRNVRGATCVAPYSTRAQAGAPVSAPLTWDELSDARPPITFDRMLRRIATLESDPWEGFFACRQSVTVAMKKKVEFKA